MLIPGIGTSVVYNSNAQKFQIFPTLSFSLSQVLQSYRENRRQKSRLKRIKLDHLSAAKNDIIKAELLYKNIEQQKRKIERSKSAFTIYQKIHQYDSLQHTKRLIKPDQYYRSQLQLISAETALISENQKLTEMISNYIHLTHQSYASP